MKCVLCEVKGYRKVGVGEIEATDTVTGERVMLCRRCYSEWVELNDVKNTLYEDKEETDK